MKYLPVWVRRRRVDYASNEDITSRQVSADEVALTGKSTGRIFCVRCQLACGRVPPISCGRRCREGQGCGPVEAAGNRLTCSP